MRDCPAVMLLLIVVFLFSTLKLPAATSPPTFRIATYNLENYLEYAIGTRPAKSAESKAAIRESLRDLRADVVALQEIGSINALQELRTSLEREGLAYPHWELVTGADTNIHVAVLSRFPIVARHPHTNDAFLLFGRKFRVSRGFAEVDIRVTERYLFTLLTVHLKSRRPVPEADEAELREQEALVLRELIETRLKANPRLNLVVLGDLNDTKDARSTRAVLGRSNSNLGLIDTRPAERGDVGQSVMQGQGAPHSTSSAQAHWNDSRHGNRQVTWTHHYGKEDTYSRLDYILLSKGMAREWLPGESYVLARPDWGVASDHRPVMTGFTAEDK